MTWTSNIFIVRPVGVQKAPAVIILQEIFGVNAHICDVARRVAALGYVAVAPDMFHRTAPRFECDYSDVAKGRSQAQAMTTKGTEADLRHSFDWINADSQADETRTAAWGFCLGGRLSLVANAILPLRAAVSFYGGTPDNLSELIQHQSGPVLLAWGGKDEHLGPVVQRRVADSFRAARKPYIDIEFSEADHGFFCNERSAYHPESAKEVWALTKAFLETHLC